MTYIKIHCGYCGNTWEIYHRDDWNNYKARTCPHCQSEIDEQIWNNEILPAFGSACDANMELSKHHRGYQKPLFSVDFVANPYLQDYKTVCPFIRRKEI